MSLNESPDGVKVSDNDRHHWSDNNAYGFGFDLEKNAYLSQEGGRHSDIKLSYEDAPHSRNYFEYPGRIWKKEKIVSFWEYPSRYKLFPLLKKLEEEWRKRFPSKKPLDFSNNWMIEKWEPGRIGAGTTQELIPLEDYEDFQTDDEHEPTHTAKLMDQKEQKLREIVREVVRDLLM